jgi:hypothetical protein
MSLLFHFYKQKLKKDLDKVKDKLPNTVYNFFISFFINYKLEDGNGLKYIKDAYKSLKCFSEHITWYENKEIVLNRNAIFNFDGEIKTISEEAKVPNAKYVISQHSIENYALLSDEVLAAAASPIIIIKDQNNHFILMDGYHRLVSRFKDTNRSNASITCTFGLLKGIDYTINIPMRDMNVIIEEFFNLDLPCPKEVPMCEKVRAAYKEELDKLMSNPQGCSQCAKNGLKSRFMESVWKEAISSITSKGS